MNRKNLKIKKSKLICHRPGWNGVEAKWQLRQAIGFALGLMSLAANQAHALAIPSGMDQPSPLFGATPFSARLVLFEEFGLQDYKSEADASKLKLTPPVDPATGLTDCQGNHDDEGLNALIRKNTLYPLPGQFANYEKDANGHFVYTNAWEQQVKDCGAVDVNASLPLDGRPPEEDFAHQRWNEFQPKKFFQSVMAGARTNGGARDQFQLHGYKQPGVVGKWSEFGPGGLYHNTMTSPYSVGGPLNAALTAAEKTKEVSAIPYAKGFEGTSNGIPVQVHPYMPVQDRNAVWTFDGTIPAKLLMARYGEPILFRHHNALPIDVAANNGFGTHTITTHEHNGHNPAESDGFAGAWFYPGQFYDYRWPMIYPGHDTINTLATDTRAAIPCEAGEQFNNGPCPADGRYKIRGDYRETVGTHWFHDHMEDYTAQNVYKGNAAMMNYYSAIDRGNEEINDGVNLRFPSGNSKNWGNRDYDVNLVVADKAFDQDGQLFFNPLITDGFLGDVMTVNWVYKPYMDTRARRYRFRILNGSVSRYMKIAVVDEKGAQVPFHLVANDGNIMEHAVAFPLAAAGVGLPVQSIAERYDIVVDFAPLYAKGIRRVYLVNLMEHADGAGPKAPVSLAAGWNAFTAVKTGYKGADLAVGKFMEFRLRPCTGTNNFDAAKLPATGQCKDPSMNPADYVAGKKVMLPLPTFTQAELKAAKHRTFKYGKKPDAIQDGKPWTIATDNGPDLTASLDRISAAPTKNSVEVWHLTSNAGGWSHPAHIHFEEGQIIKRNGIAPPVWEKYSRKDMYRIGPAIQESAKMDIAIRIRDFVGTFVQHCHNTQHEDHAMLLRWDSENADHAKWVRTPYPNWDGVHYDVPGEGVTHKEPTADTGSKTVTEAQQFVLPATWGLKAADVPVTAAPAMP